MAKLVIECSPDTEYLEQVARTIGKHLTALADELATIRAAAEQATEDVRDLPAEERAGLRLPRHLHDAMLAHCLAEHPVEACGVMPGPRAGDVPDRIVPMRNAEQSTVAYRFDPDNQVAVWQEMHERDERPVVIYHSHTKSRPFPSKLDIQHAAVPEAHWVIVATSDLPATVRSFRIVDGKVTEEQVTVV